MGSHCCLCLCWEKEEELRLDWRSGWGGGGDARMKQVSWRVGVLSGVGAG